MNYQLITIILFIFGSLFGSFASVLIYRLKSREKGIILGRSHCNKCNKKLKFYDLFPIFSWISTFGKCRYCKTKISFIYPLLELSMGAVFALVGIYLVDFNLILNGNILEIWNLFFYLGISFITIVYIFYDIVFLEIHDSVMFFGIVLSFIGIFVKSSLSIGVLYSFILGLFGVLVLSVFYLIMLKELREEIDFLLLILVSIFSFLIYYNFSFLTENPIFSGIIGALGIFIFFYLQIFLSKGRALGGGDLRIGIMIGLLLGISGSFLGIIASYIIGAFIGIFIIIKNWKKKGANIVPFGPFLGAGFFSVLFFSNYIEFYLEKFLYIL